MAFLVSLVLTGAALICYMLIGPNADQRTPDSDVQFAAYVLNMISIAWLVWVLARTEKKDSAEFGSRMTENLASLYTAIGISGSYSIVQLFYMLVPTVE